MAAWKMVMAMMIEMFGAGERESEQLMQKRRLIIPGAREGGREERQTTYLTP
jgi:hypothetical protein